MTVGVLVAALAQTPGAAQVPELPAATESAAELGMWTSPFSEDGDGDGRGDFDDAPPQTRAESARHPAAVNSVVLPDGTVLYLSQLEGTEAIDTTVALERPDPARSRTRILDPVSAQTTGPLWSVPAPEDAHGADFTGADQRHLGDGRVLVAGGSRWSNEDASLDLPAGIGRTEVYGDAGARIFDPVTKAWTRAATMNRGRYYPSLVTLGDGRILAVGGADRLLYDSSLFPGPHPPADAVPELVREVEAYDPAGGVWRLEPGDADVSLPPFARLHLLPDGRLFYPAVGILYPPGGGDSEAASWGRQRWYDPGASRWIDAGPAPLGVRSNAISVLLRLRPPYDRAEMLVAGGTLGPWPGAYLATPLSELVTWDSAAPDPGVPERKPVGPMTTGRWHSSAALLPTGEVVAFSGADRDELVEPGSGSPVRHAEIYDPATGAWKALASAQRGRTLHNTAVLLPDGSVLVGGHSPAPAHYGSHVANAPGLSSNFKDPSFEIFRPPYLFRGSRPVIETVSTSSLRRGGCAVVRTPDANHARLEVVLSRLPATTHGIDADQRMVVVPHRALGSGTIKIEIPDAPAVLPPGPYYLFLLKDDGDGLTPSVARIVTIGAGSANTC